MASAPGIADDDAAFNAWLEKLKDGVGNPIPVSCLNKTARTRLALFLNPAAGVGQFSSDGVPQDWSGLAELMGVEFQITENLKQDQDPTAALIKLYSTRRNSTLIRLMKFLDELERSDLIADPSFTKAIGRDVKSYCDRQHEEENEQRPVQVQTVDTTVPTVVRTISQDDLSDDDCEEHISMHNGQIYTGKYDAFIAYADGDKPFVDSMISGLQSDPHNFIICTEEDLLIGVSKYTAVSRLLFKRCRRVILVVSQHFPHSEMCDFVVKFVHALSPGARNRKMLPVVIGQIPDLPGDLPLLLHLSMHTYKRYESGDQWFWERLACSMRKPTMSTSSEDTADTPPGPRCILPPSHITPLRSSQKSSSSRSLPKAMVQESSHRACSSSSPSRNRRQSGDSSSAKDMVRESGESGETHVTLMQQEVCRLRQDEQMEHDGLSLHSVDCSGSDRQRSGSDIGAHSHSYEEAMDKTGQDSDSNPKRKKGKGLMPKFIKTLRTRSRATTS